MASFINSIKRVFYVFTFCKWDININKEVKTGNILIKTSCNHIYELPDNINKEINRDTPEYLLKPIMEGFIYCPFCSRKIRGIN